jgi:hypothetical protein
MDCPRVPAGQQPSKTCWDAYLKGESTLLTRRIMHSFQPMQTGITGLIYACGTETWLMRAPPPPSILFPH